MLKNLRNIFQQAGNMKSAEIHKAVSKCNVQAKSVAAKELHRFLETIDDALNSYWEL